MLIPDVRNDWLEKGIALVFATIAVLGAAIVLLTLSMSLPGPSNGSIPVP